MSWKERDHVLNILIRAAESAITATHSDEKERFNEARRMVFSVHPKLFNNSVHLSWEEHDEIVTRFFESLVKNPIDALLLCFSAESAEDSSTKVVIF